MLNESKNSKFCRIYIYICHIYVIDMSFICHIYICVFKFILRSNSKIKRGCGALAADATGFAKTCLRPWRFEVPQPSAWGVQRRAPCWVDFFVVKTPPCSFVKLEVMRFRKVHVG